MTRYNYTDSNYNLICVDVCDAILIIIAIQEVGLASLAHSLCVHAFHLCIYCMEGYCWSHSIMIA